MKLVLIEWIDSHSHRPAGWRPLEEIEQEGEPLTCRSVGWLLHESKSCKTIVPHVSGEKNEDIVLCGHGEICIPTKAIVKMIVLPKKYGQWQSTNCQLLGHR